MLFVSSPNWPLIDDGGEGDVVVICGIDFFAGKFNGNCVFSLIKLRGNCIPGFSLIFDDDVDDAVVDTLTTFELGVTVIDGIDDEPVCVDERISVESANKRVVAAVAAAAAAAVVVDDGNS